MKCMSNISKSPTFVIHGMSSGLRYRARFDPLAELGEGFGFVPPGWWNWGLSHPLKIPLAIQVYIDMDMDMDMDKPCFPQFCLPPFFVQWMVRCLCSLYVCIKLCSLTFTNYRVSYWVQYLSLGTTRG